MNASYAWNQCWALERVAALAMAKGLGLTAREFLMDSNVGGDPA